MTVGERAKPVAKTKRQERGGEKERKGEKRYSPPIPPLAFLSSPSFRALSHRHLAFLDAEKRELQEPRSRGGGGVRGACASPIFL